MHYIYLCVHIGVKIGAGDQTNSQNIEHIKIKLPIENIATHLQQLHWLKNVVHKFNLLSE